MTFGKMATYALEASFSVNKILQTNQFPKVISKQFRVEMTLESYGTLKTRKKFNWVSLGPTGAKWDTPELPEA